MPKPLTSTTEHYLRIFWYFARFRQICVLPVSGSHFFDIPEHFSYQSGHEAFPLREDHSVTEKFSCL